MKRERKICRCIPFNGAYTLPSMLRECIGRYVDIAHYITADKRSDHTGAPLPFFSLERKLKRVILTWLCSVLSICDWISSFHGLPAIIVGSTVGNIWEVFKERAEENKIFKINKQPTKLLGECDWQARWIPWTNQGKDWAEMSGERFTILFQKQVQPTRTDFPSVFQTLIVEGWLLRF